MKTKKISIEVSEAKLSALEVFIKTKNSTVELELQDTFNKLYERVVPNQVKLFVKETSPAKNSDGLKIPKVGK